MDIQIMKYIFIALVFTLFLAGCAHNSGVIPMAGNQYMLSNQGHSFLASMPKLRQEARSDASRHCITLGKNLSIIRYEDAAGPYVAGNFPRTDLIFTCE